MTLCVLKVSVRNRKPYKGREHRRVTVIFSVDFEEEYTLSGEIVVLLILERVETC